MFKKIVVKKFFSDEEMQKKEGKFIDDSGVKIYKESVDIYNNEGKILVRFRKNVLTKKECETLLESKGAASKTIRPNASGSIKGKKKYTVRKSKKSNKIVISLSRQKGKKKDSSGIMGFYDSISYFGAVSNRELNKKNKNNYISGLHAMRDTSILTWIIYGTRISGLSWKIVLCGTCDESST